MSHGRPRSYLNRRGSLLLLLAGLLVVVLGTLAIGLLITSVAESVAGDEGAVPDDYHLDPIRQETIVDALDEDPTPDDPSEPDRVVSTTRHGRTPHTGVDAGGLP